MRAEKKYLVDEVGGYLDKSDYVFLANYDRITVEETAELRRSLAEHNAEFHVVKNRILRLAVKSRELPDMESYLIGPTAVIVGGDSPPAVAKSLEKFKKTKDKVEIKGGLLNGKIIQPDEVQQLAKLPSHEALKAQLLGLLNTPAQRMVTVLQAVPQSVLTLLQNKADKGEGSN